MFAWLPSRSTGVSAHSPLTSERPTTVMPRSVKKATASSKSGTAMPTLSSLMGHHWSLSPELTTRLADHVRPSQGRPEQHSRPLTCPPPPGIAGFRVPHTLCIVVRTIAIPCDVKRNT